MGKTCKEYQDDLKISAINDKNAQIDKQALEVYYYWNNFYLTINIFI